jgi:predicted Zn-dependent protease
MRRSPQVTSHSGRLSAGLPSLAERLQDGRPVFTQDQLTGLSRRIMALTRGEHTGVSITHRFQSMTRLSHDKIRAADEGDTLSLAFYSRLGQAGGVTYLATNQIDEASLRDLVARADLIASQMIGSTEKLMMEQRTTQDEYLPAPLWYDATAEALRSARETAIPTVFDMMRKHDCRVAGYVGVIARADAVMKSDGIYAYSNETDSEISVTARTGDVTGPGVGWNGQSARDWTKIDAARVATVAAELALRGRRPQAVEPGRRTAILGPAAVVQLARFLAFHFNGETSDKGSTGFSKSVGRSNGSRYNQRVFDPSIQITSDPMSVEGSYRPWASTAMANPKMTWIDNGVLKNLAYGVTAAIIRGRPYSEVPFAMQIAGGDSSIEQMIAKCEEGIYVNRFSDVDLVNLESGLMTGVTQGGCFLVKHGKIDRPVKNFRFMDSPMFVLNKLVALGPSSRATFGYSPPTRVELGLGHGFQFEWPRRPMVVPPMMVNDFNFAALSDAV